MTEEQIKKVTKEKNPNRVAAGKKSYETHMIKVKEDILTNSSNTTSNTTSNTPSDTSNTPSATRNTSNVSTSKSYVAHMYGVGILTVLAIGLCVFYYSSDIKRVIKREKKKDSTDMTTVTTNKENTIHRRKML